MIRYLIMQSLSREPIVEQVSVGFNFMQNQVNDQYLHSKQTIRN